jgi:UDP-N-acetylglucosamine acyltransferase
VATQIHPLALLAPDVELGEGVTVGPFAVIEPGVVVGDGTRVDAHAVVRSGTRLGARNVVHPFAVIGGDPQERGYGGEPTRLEIGDGNVFREHVTVHRGSVKGGGLTRIGGGSLFMVGVHVAHDCALGDRLELANGTLLGGHVTLGDHVATGGGAAIGPWLRVGTRAFIAAGAMVEADVPPFVIAAGDRARVRALNRVGLARSGVPEASREALARAFRAVFRGAAPRAVAAAALVGDADAYVRELAAFVAGAPAHAPPGR